jgi:D-alanine-D-alanine ligase
MEYTKMDDAVLYEQEMDEGEKPPSILPRPVKPWRVAVIANVKGKTSSLAEGPEDAGAEYDKEETIQSICNAISSDGHNTIFIPADINLPFALKEAVPDICFNIAEGMGGDGREAHAPAIFEMLHIPYTASRVTANAIALDKTLTKRIWRDNGLPIAPFQEFSSADEQIDPGLRYPMFVKPAREGTGMGMGLASVVHNATELRARIQWVISKYNQPALVEEYLPGREFTVGILGRPGCNRFVRHPELYRADGFHRMPPLEVESAKSVTPGVYGISAKQVYPGEAGYPEFLCPAPISEEFSHTLQELAVKAHRAIGALDVSRVDFRCDAEGNPYLLEINSLPGLTPDFSDLCVIAHAENISYRDLILEILYLGASRWGLVEEAVSTELKMPLAAELSAPGFQRTRIPARVPYTIRARTLLR